METSDSAQNSIDQGEKLSTSQEEPSDDSVGFSTSDKTQEDSSSKLKEDDSLKPLHHVTSANIANSSKQPSPPPPSGPVHQKDHHRY